MPPCFFVSIADIMSVRGSRGIFHTIIGVVKSTSLRNLTKIPCAEAQGILLLNPSKIRASMVTSDKMFGNRFAARHSMPIMRS